MKFFSPVIFEVSMNIHAGIVSKDPQVQNHEICNGSFPANDHIINSCKFQNLFYLDEGVDSSGFDRFIESSSLSGEILIVKYYGLFNQIYFVNDFSSFQILI